MTWRISLVLMLAFQVGLIALVRYRTDLSPWQFVATYWVAIGAALMVIGALWFARTDD